MTIGIWEFLWLCLVKRQILNWENDFLLWPECGKTSVKVTNHTTSNLGNLTIAKWRATARSERTTLKGSWKYCQSDLLKTNWNAIRRKQGYLTSGNPRARRAVGTTHSIFSDSPTTGPSHGKDIGSSNARRRVRKYARRYRWWGNGVREIDTNPLMNSIGYCARSWEDIFSISEFDVTYVRWKRCYTTP